MHDWLGMMEHNICDAFEFTGLQKLENVRKIFQPLCSDLDFFSLQTATASVAEARSDYRVIFQRPMHR